uniref:Uncharacterized protein n=1 Tax=Glossina austeni TaxID=7395 RepID=A0A1A9VLQ1_GLOAU
MSGPETYSWRELCSAEIAFWYLLNIHEVRTHGTQSNVRNTPYDRPTYESLELFTNTMAPTICSGKKQPSRTLRNDIRRQYRNNSSNAVPSSVFNYKTCTKVSMTRQH